MARGSSFTLKESFLEQVGFGTAILDVPRIGDTLEQAGELSTSVRIAGRWRKDVNERPRLEIDMYVSSSSSWDSATLSVHFDLGYVALVLAAVVPSCRFLPSACLARTAMP